MTADGAQHWDEGTIHAWLDGALDAPTSAAMETHVSGCPQCSTRVAEARGLVAGASRIVAALDDDVDGAAPTWGAHTAAPAEPTVSRRLRVTPARAAIAAVVLVAVGLTLTRDRTAPDTLAEAARGGLISGAPAPGVSPPSAANGGTGTGAGARDPLLDSAIARNVAQAQPPRTVAAQPGLAPPSAPPLPAPSVRPDTTADLRVAVARAAVRAARESLPARADRATAGGLSRADNVVAAAATANSAAAPPTPGIAARSVSGSRVTVRPAAECYQVEGAGGVRASWGQAALPFVVALDPDGSARLLGEAGIARQDSVSWTRGAADSLDLRLRGAGLTGSLALGGPGETRGGVMRSSLAPTPEAAEPIATIADAGRRARSRRTERGSANDPARVDQTRTDMHQLSATVAPVVPVVARRVRCM